MRFERLRRALAAALWWGYLAFVVLFVIHASYFAFRNQYGLPYADDWRLFDDLFSQAPLDWLITPQNGHLVPVTLSLFFLDYQFFLGRMNLLVSASLLFAWLTFAVFRVGLRTDPDMRSRLGTATFAFGCFLLTWAWSTHDFLWGVNQGTVLAVLLIFVALSMLALREARRASDPQANTGRLLLIAGLAAWAAPFCHAMGFVIWPTLILILLLCGGSFRIVLSFAAGMLVSAGSYALTSSEGGGAMLQEYAILLTERPLYVIERTASFVGAPLAHAAAGVVPLEGDALYRASVLAGEAGLMVFAVCLAMFLWRRERRSPADILCIGLMVLPVATGVLITLNRFIFKSTGIGIRFIACETLFWVGIACAAALVALRWKPRGTHVLALLFLWVLSLSALPRLEQQRLRQAARRDALTLRAHMHVLGIRADAYTRWQPLRASADAPDVVYRVVERFEKDRRSFFAMPWADLPDQRIEDHFDSTPPRKCAGRIQGVNEVKSRSEPAAIVRGWSKPPAGGAPDLFVIADDGGIIRGLGTSQRNKHQRLQTVTWLAFIADYRTSTSYVVYVVGPDGRSVCRIGAIRYGKPLIERAAKARASGGRRSKIGKDPS